LSLDLTLTQSCLLSQHCPIALFVVLILGSFFVFFGFVQQNITYSSQPSTPKLEKDANSSSMFSIYGTTTAAATAPPTGSNGTYTNDIFGTVSTRATCCCALLNLLISHSLSLSASCFRCHDKANPNSSKGFMLSLSK